MCVDNNFCGNGAMVFALDTFVRTLCIRDKGMLQYINILQYLLLLQYNTMQLLIRKY